MIAHICIMILEWDQNNYAIYNVVSKLRYSLILKSWFCFDVKLIELVKTVQNCFSSFNMDLRYPKIRVSMLRMITTRLLTRNKWFSIFMVFWWIVLFVVTLTTFVLFKICFPFNMHYFLLFFVLVLWNLITSMHTGTLTKRFLKQGLFVA